MRSSWRITSVILLSLNWLLIRTVYRLTIKGSENFPSNGGALLVCNHVSYVDASILLASCHRPVRFFIYKPIYESLLVKPVAKALGAIPVQSGGSKEENDRGIKFASSVIQSGDLVGIFAEGGITRTGEIAPFKRGLERIMQGIDAPIIPVYLGELWGSIFSFEGGKAIFKWPKKIPYPVTVTFGKPMPADSTSEQVRDAVEGLAKLAGA